MTVHPYRPRINGRKRFAAIGVALIMSAGVVAACESTGDSGGGGGDGGSGSTLDKIREQGYVTVGFANERPYAYREGGELIGEAPAIQGEIFSRIGDIEVRGQQFEFGALIPALNAGEIDVVTAGMFITPERCEQAAFSNPEYTAPTALLVKAGNPKGLSDYESVAQNDAKLAVMNGAVEVDQSAAAGVGEDQQEIVADQQAGLDALTSGRVDAFALTSISLRALADGNDDVEVTDPFVPVVDGKEQVGAGAAVFRQEDTELVEAFNEELAALLEEEGTWLSLVEEFGFTEAEKPDPGLTAEQFCEG